MCICTTFASFAIILSDSEGCLFTLLIVSSAVQKLLILIVPFVYFCFYFQYSGRWVIEDPAVVYVREWFFFITTFFLTLQYCIGFTIYQHESAYVFL